MAYSDHQNAKMSFTRHVPFSRGFYDPAVIAFSGHQNANLSFIWLHGGLDPRSWEPAGIAFSGLQNNENLITESKVLCIQLNHGPWNMAFPGLKMPKSDSRCQIPLGRGSHDPWEIAFPRRQNTDVFLKTPYTLDARFLRLATNRIFRHL